MILIVITSLIVVVNQIVMDNYEELINPINACILAEPEELKNPIGALQKIHGVDMLQLLMVGVL